jgi:hypothetical protein
MPSMKIGTGKVVEGRIVPDGEPLAEGLIVTYMAREEAETFDVTQEEEEALLAALAEAKDGRVASWEGFRDQLRLQA